MTDDHLTRTCPKCGALIVPQLTNCRQCKTYLHGTQLEGWIFQNLLGGYMSGSPGTALLCLMIALYYVLMVVLAGPQSAPGFSHFSLVQLGATHGPSIMLGQYWRFVTSIFGHHDVLHIGLNLWCLVTAGPLVEQIFDRKKMIVLYVVSGVASMAISHLWYAVWPASNILVVSAGASGAVCGMIGAAWLGARRLGPVGVQVAQGMKRWAILLILWGFFVPGINNAAHFGGFAVGALLAHLIPIGLTQSVKTQRVLSVLVLGLLGLIGASTVAMLANLHGYPAALDNDAYPRSIFGYVYADGVEFPQSAQVAAARDCDEQIRGQSPIDEKLRVCELNLRINDHHSPGYRASALIAEMRGHPERALQLRVLARKIQAQTGTRR